jgi:hypothetical protein
MCFLMKKKVSVSAGKVQKWYTYLKSELFVKSSVCGVSLVLQFINSVVLKKSFNLFKLISSSIKQG